MIHLLVSLLLAAPPQQSLRELAKPGVEAGIVVDCDCGPLELREEVAKVDLIVWGTVTSAAPHLTTDETEIHTTYRLEVKQIVARRTDDLATTIGLEFTQRGGSLTIDGTPISYDVGWLPKLRIGVETILLLNRDAKSGAYTNQAGVAFEVRENRATAMTLRRVLDPEYVGISSTALVELLRQLVGETWTSR